VAYLACAIAEEMGRIGDDQMKGITPQFFINIGKLHVAFELLNNPGHLTNIELALIKRHPQAACDILKIIEFPWPVARIAQQHHEHLDESGYPAGLRGDSILLEARIIGIADVVEAMSSEQDGGLKYLTGIVSIIKHESYTAIYNRNSASPLTYYPYTIVGVLFSLLQLH
jgi:HD-GYP domain-containing protein (c-di-GMP phosphodiesterase class II)